MQELITLDFEASSLDLQDSYPIEVGYFNGHSGNSTLIIPTVGWTNWDPASQEIHKISREELFKDGSPVEEVAHHLNAVLGNKIVYCDGGLHDLFWMYRLYEAANMKCSFKLKSDQVIGLKQEAKHRALDDAIQLWHGLKRQYRL